MEHLKHAHTPEHDILRLRTNVLYRDLPDLDRRARAALSACRDGWNTASNSASSGVPPSVEVQEEPSVEAADTPANESPSTADNDADDNRSDDKTPDGEGNEVKEATTELQQPSTPEASPSDTDLPGAEENAALNHEDGNTMDPSQAGAEPEPAEPGA